MITKGQAAVAVYKSVVFIVKIKPVSHLRTQERRHHYMHAKRSAWRIWRFFCGSWRQRRRWCEPAANHPAANRAENTAATSQARVSHQRYVVVSWFSSHLKWAIRCRVNVCSLGRAKVVSQLNWICARHSQVCDRGVIGVSHCIGNSLQLADSVYQLV